MALRRKFGFAGTVSLSLQFPKESGLSSTVVVLGPGQSIARLPVVASAGTKPGMYQGKLASKLTFNKASLQDGSTVNVEVVVAKAATGDQ